MNHRLDYADKFKANLQIVAPVPESAFKTIVHPWPWHQCVWHYHKEYELHLILNASGQIWIGDYIGAFSHGHLVLVGPDLPHNWTSYAASSPSQPAQEDHVIQFSEDSFGSRFFDVPDLSAIKDLLVRSAQGIEFLDRDPSIIKRICRIGVLCGVERFLCLIEILRDLAGMADYRILCSPSYSPAFGQSDATRINKILAHMRANLASEITMESLCCDLHLQPRSFSRFFRQVTGRRFSDYLCEMRISEACNQLLNTDRPITDICFAVGFSNVSWFNRCFFEIKGVTPREYRRTAAARYGPFDQRGKKFDNAALPHPASVLADANKHDGPA